MTTTTTTTTITTYYYYYYYYYHYDYCELLNEAERKLFQEMGKHINSGNNSGTNNANVRDRTSEWFHPWRE